VDLGRRASTDRGRFGNVTSGGTIGAGGDNASLVYAPIHATRDLIARRNRESRRGSLSRFDLGHVAGVELNGGSGTLKSCA
jgi:hypothetical protein